MKFTLLVISALTAVVAAHPSPNGGDADLILPRAGKTSASSAVDKNNNSTSAATDNIPSFKQKCVCPTPICDPRLNAKSLCQCKASAAEACWIKSGGGCTKPKQKAC